MTPVPVIILLAFFRFCKIVILFVMFLEVSPVRLILSGTPFMRIVVSFIFVVPARWSVLAVVVWVVTVLGADQYGNDQGRTQCDQFEKAIHDNIFLLNFKATLQPFIPAAYCLKIMRQSAFSIHRLDYQGDPNSPTSLPPQ